MAFLTFYKILNKSLTIMKNFEKKNFFRNVQNVLKPMPKITIKKNLNFYGLSNFCLVNLFINRRILYLKEKHLKVDKYPF